MELIDSLEPDLVFLDVRMPEKSGIEVATQIRHRPFIVFTTAYDQYAVTAFELAAVDYLLKPFSRKRFGQAMERIRDRVQQKSGGDDLGERVQGALASSRILDKMFVRQGSRILPVALEDVVHFQAAENYISLRVGGQSFMIHLAMADLEKHLDPSRFVRIHRSHIVNLNHIRAMEVFDDRRLLVCLSNGEKVLASRSGSQTLKRRIM